MRRRQRLSPPPTRLSSDRSVGSHSITVVYAGDTDFTTSTSSALTQTVNQDATTSAVVSSANASVFRSERGKPLHHRGLRRRHRFHDQYVISFDADRESGCDDVSGCLLRQRVCLQIGTWEATPSPWSTPATQISRPVRHQL